MEDDIQRNAMTSDLSFLDFFMGTLIDDARWTPKLQLERVIGPLLTPFIARLITGALQNVDGMRGEYELICSEFPLLKKTDPNTYLSTNIDWLLLNNTNNKLVFLELKTTHETYSTKQAQIYSQYVNNSSSDVSSNLWANYISICNNSRHKRKYHRQCKKISNFLSITRAGSQVVYLSPEQAGDNPPKGEDIKLAKPPDHVLSFKDLNFAIKGAHSSAWDIIREHLVRLDQQDNSTIHLCGNCKPKVSRFRRSEAIPG